MAQWLRTCLAMQGTWAQSLVQEVRSHMPRGAATTDVHMPQRPRSTKKEVTTLQLEKEIQGLNSFLKNNLKNEVFRKFSSEETKKPSEISVLTLQQGSNYLPLFSLFPGTLLHFHLPPAVCSLHPQDTAFFKALHSRPSPIVCTLNLSLHAAFRTDYITHSPR